MVGGENGDGGCGPGFRMRSYDIRNHPNQTTGSVALAGFRIDLVRLELRASSEAAFDQMPRCGDVSMLSLNAGGGAINGLLNESFIWVGQFEKLLGVIFCGNGPEPFSTSAGHDKCETSIHWLDSLLNRPFRKPWPSRMISSCVFHAIVRFASSGILLLIRDSAIPENGSFPGSLTPSNFNLSLFSM